MLGEMSAGHPLSDDDVRQLARLLFTTLGPLRPHLA
jgi:hypothetical protein